MLDEGKQDAIGVIRVTDLPQLVHPETRLVAAMLANNETGVLQPIAELAAICNERGVPLHVPLECRARLTEVDGRKMYMTAELTGTDDDAAVVYCRSRATFIAILPETFGRGA